MAPRRTIPTSPQSVNSTRSTRSSRSNPTAELPREKRQAFSHRRPLNQPIPAKKSVTRRLTRGNLTNDDNEENASESGTDADKEDGNDDDNDADKPAAFAPSGMVTRKRGHQTGLSLTLSTTSLDRVSRGKKRELSTSITKDEEARPHKQRKRRAPEVPSDNSDSDDRAYDAVDDISDSEGDASDIERSEEQNIIASVENARKPPSDADSWGGFTLDGIPVDDDSPFFSEHFAVTEPNSEMELMDIVGHALDPASPSSNAPTRRVRFAGVPSSSSSGVDSEVDEAAFPDLLFDREHLHPETRQMLNLDGEDAQQLSEESYWELDQNEEPPPPKVKHVPPPPPPPPQQSSDDYSGYETDSSSGQTTDDGAVPPLTVHHPHTVLRLNAKEQRNKAARVRRANPSARTANKSGKGPCMGTWIADPSKPIGVIDPQTKRMIYIAPRAPSLPYGGIRHNVSSADSSPPSAYIDLDRKRWARQPWPGQPRKYSDSESSQKTDSLDGATPDFAAPAAETIMVSGVQRPLVTISQMEAFYTVDHSLMEEEDFDDDEDPDEAQLDINAFIDFGEHESDSPDGEPDFETDEVTSPITPLSSQRLPTITPKRLRGRSSSQNLLEHFDKGVVSAFRRNQSRHYAVLRRPLASARIQAIKGGRHSAADIPISPIRKRKDGRSLSSPMAPFTGINHPRLRSGTL